MAVTGFWPVFKNLKATLDYADNPDKTTALEYLDEDLYAALRYAENDNKTDRKMFVGGINCSAQNITTICARTPAGKSAARRSSVSLISRTVWSTSV